MAGPLKKGFSMASSNFSGFWPLYVTFLSLFWSKWSLFDHFDQKWVKMDTIGPVFLVVGKMAIFGGQSAHFGTLLCTF